jgi:hypothetical protein
MRGEVTSAGTLEAFAEVCDSPSRVKQKR